MINELYGPYFQSQRLEIYKTHYLKLIKNEKAYICIVKGDDLVPEYDSKISLELIKISQIISISYFHIWYIYYTVFKFERIELTLFWK